MKDEDLAEENIEENDDLFDYYEWYKEFCKSKAIEPGDVREILI